MPLTDSTSRLSGMLTALVTPFDADGNVWLDPIPDLLDFQRQAGMNGVVVSGTNGEGTSLSVAERKRLLETVLAHRGDLTIIAGTGAASLADALELTRHAADVGADAALALPPFFYKNATTPGLANAFRAVLEVAPDLPTLLYHIPQMTGIPLTGELFGLLDDCPNLVGLKDSSGDWNGTSGWIARHPNLRVFVGNDRWIASTLNAGGAGAILGISNAFPERVAAIGRAHQQNANGDAAQEAQAALDRIAAITTRYPFIAVSKTVLAHRGLPRLTVRPPLVNLTPAQEAQLLAELHDAAIPLPHPATQGRAGLHG